MAPFEINTRLSACMHLLHRRSNVDLLPHIAPWMTKYTYRRNISLHAVTNHRRWPWIPLPLVVYYGSTFHDILYYIITTHTISHKAAGRCRIISCSIGWYWAYLAISYAGQYFALLLLILIWWYDIELFRQSTPRSCAKFHLLFPMSHHDKYKYFYLH